jgi:hypothetical protein
MTVFTVRWLLCERESKYYHTSKSDIEVASTEDKIGETINLVSHQSGKRMVTN